MFEVIYQSGDVFAALRDTFCFGSDGDSSVFTAKWNLPEGTSGENGGVSGGGGENVGAGDGSRALSLELGLDVVDYSEPPEGFAG